MIASRFDRVLSLRVVCPACPQHCQVWAAFRARPEHLTTRREALTVAAGMNKVHPASPPSDSAKHS